ncbi:fumarylacetoacetate hydrolase family protein [Streptomyces sp. NPDC005318]|uniref:fumarylacetoacetate hydrolase family protein n=1 Tax=Streptomyces sp. NPDC005318 TaxID=3157031 RepID=UPI0033B0AF28
MKLATIRTTDGTACVRIDTATATETGYADLGALLSEPGWREIAEAADGPVHAVADLDYAPVVPRPGKVVCVGLNYRNHIQEMGREIPQYPTLFTKFPEALVGAHDDIVLPAVSDAVDWEAELAVVIGTTVRHADQEAATAAIAGYSVLNDVTIRDWQYRTTQWHQGKSFEATTPFGPVMVTPDEVDAGAGLRLAGEVDGETVQQADTSDLVFDAATLVAYISTMVTLRPGDVIATGTPGGVGHARTPQRYLTEGQVLTTRIDGIGECRNATRKEKTTGA